MYKHKELVNHTFHRLSTARMDALSLTRDDSGRGTRPRTRYRTVIGVCLQSRVYLSKFFTVLNLILARPSQHIVFII